MARLTPGSFHEALKGTPADVSRKNLQDTVYKVKILRVLGKTFSIASDVIDAVNNRNIDYPMDYIKDRVGNPLFSKMQIEHLCGVTIGSLLQTDASNKALAKARTLDIVNGFGLIFPVEHYGDWIMHNLGAAEGLGAGSARIVLQSRYTDLPDVWVESLKQFLSNLPPQ